MWMGEGGCVVHPLGLGLKGPGSDMARGGEPAHDATVTMSPFRNRSTRWRHDSWGRCLAFGLPTGGNGGGGAHKG